MPTTKTLLIALGLTASVAAHGIVTSVVAGGRTQVYPDFDNFFAYTIIVTPVLMLESGRNPPNPRLDGKSQTIPTLVSSHRISMLHQTSSATRMPLLLACRPSWRPAVPLSCNGRLGPKAIMDLSSPILPTAMVPAKRSTKLSYNSTRSRRWECTLTTPSHTRLASMLPINLSRTGTSGQSLFPPRSPRETTFSATR